MTTGLFFWLLCVLFAALAVDALRSHGPRSPAFQPEEADPNSPDLMLQPLVQRSGRTIAAVFTLVSLVCALVAWLSD